VLALSSACRHPAIALSIATAIFPNERWLRRRRLGASNHLLAGH
jgi:hypothetical protein